MVLKKKVLIIDDDLNSCRQIKYALQDSTTDVYYALSVSEGMKQFMKQEYCLVIVDIVLAEADGRELLKVMRRAKTIPILVLSSKAGIENRISAYQAGAHAYLEKPYELEECLAQAESLMALYVGLKPQKEQCYTLVFGVDLIIDPDRREVTLKGQPLNLTRKEFELLFCLASHAGQVLSREQLYSMVWNSEQSYNIDEIVKSHIKALRRKLTPANRAYIKNVWGIGYQFLDEDNDIHGT
ncbi:response regulator transcription factor [Hungatella hathewayi]